jgi:hypothetical protein
MKDETPKNYLVHLKIQDGEFGKGSKHLIHSVDNVEDAIEYAIQGESHDREDNTPPNEYGWYEDAGGQLMYKVSKVVEVSTDDFEILKKYL